MRIEKLITVSPDRCVRLTHDQLAELFNALDIYSLAADLANVHKDSTNRIQTPQAAQHGH